MIATARKTVSSGPWAGNVSVRSHPGTHGRKELERFPKKSIAASGRGRITPAVSSPVARQTASGTRAPLTARTAGSSTLVSHRTCPSAWNTRSASLVERARVGRHASRASRAAASHAHRHWSDSSTARSVWGGRACCRTARRRGERRPGGIRCTCCGVTRHPTGATHVTRVGGRLAKVQWGTPASTRQPLFSQASKI